MKKIREFFNKLGPGLITGASDDDPSGIATYTQAGAKFGLNTLWTALYLYPLVSSIQEMCARVGIVTGKGLAGNLKSNYPKSILYLALMAVTPSIIVNIGADLSAMGAVAHMVCPVIADWAFSVFFTLLLLLCMIYFSYEKFARVLKYLCLILFVYFIIPFLSNQNWLEILYKSLWPQIKLDREYLVIVTALLGTTISPYLFFWQASMEVEEMQHKNTGTIIYKKLIGNMRKDVGLGMVLTNLTFFFIILTAGTVLNNSGITDVESVQQAATALKPLAGNGAYLLFAIGIIGTGLIAIPVLSGALSYMLAETFNWQNGFDKKFHEAKTFYIVTGISLLFGLLIQNFGISPIKALLYTAILNGITAPILIALIIHMCNQKRIMGEHTNGWMSNFKGIITFLVMFLAGIGLLFL